MSRVPGRESPLDAGGRFVLGGLASLPDRAVHLRVETGGAVYRAQGQRPVADPATGEQVGEIEVRIPGNNPDAGYEGTVTDEAGAPVEGALVLVGGTLPSVLGIWMRGDLFLDEARTDAAGRWRVVPEYGPGNASQVLILHPDFAPALVPVPSRMRKRTLDAILRRGATVEVRVRDAAGRPAAGAEVVAQMRHPHPEAAWRDFGDVHGALRAHPRTDAGGCATVDALGEGTWYLAVRSADGREGTRVLLEVPPGATGLAVEVALAPLPVVRGTIRVRGGDVPRGAFLFVPGATVSEFLQVPVDPSGRFESPPLLTPSHLLVDGKVPLFEPRIDGPGDVLGLAEPGVDLEIVVDAPEPSSVR